MKRATILRSGFQSLYLRLLAGAALWSLIALVAAGFILTNIYRQTVENAFDERLGVYLKSLVGAFADQAPGPIADPGNLGEQRFEQIFSGWYWQVRRGADGPVILASGSLFTDTLESPRRAPGAPRDEVAGGTIERADGQSLRTLEQAITFTGNEDSPSQDYEILVAGDARRLVEEVADFRNRVALTLAIFGLGLALSTIIQVRWGLRPLDRVRQSLADMRSGRETRFDTTLPVEIAPLGRELNALLQSNREIVERARTQVGNLAHALKTPLSVITNEARSATGPLADKVAEQAEAMRSQVSHYLDRARIGAGAGVIGNVTKVEPALSRLVRTMEKIHGIRGIEIEASLPAAALFRGEQQDLEEIAGNLLDNACKWARSRVELAVAYEPPKDEETPGRLTLTVTDDGPGLTAEEQAEATRRGRRLDESKPGWGLGLSIVSELVGLYGGKFTLAKAEEGGLAARVELPGA